ncbi:hypothetical protein EVAR_81502_1 [Eumeta japonica]|uniref:Uncharacterized protein n=1 Tax=Eumeta variegata TaxID=151549 RepID=A0A4C1W3I2_EUMVA|nr:hypothetical protein EVAR_81502_1 [Eumeta japonica]
MPFTDYKTSTFNYMRLRVRCGPINLIRSGLPPPRNLDRSVWPRIPFSLWHLKKKRAGRKVSLNRVGLSVTVITRDRRRTRRASTTAAKFPAVCRAAPL